MSILLKRLITRKLARISRLFKRFSKILFPLLKRLTSLTCCR